MLYSEVMMQSLREAWLQRRLWLWLALYGVLGLLGIYTLDLLIPGVVQQLLINFQATPWFFAVMLFVKFSLLFWFVAIPAIVVRLYQNPNISVRTVLRQLVQNGAFWFIFGLSFLFAVAYYRVMSGHVLLLLGMKSGVGQSLFGWEDGVEIAYAILTLFAPVLVWRTANPLVMLELNFREIWRGLGILCFAGFLWLAYSAIISVGINWLTFAKIAPALKASKMVGIVGATVVTGALNYVVYLVFLLVPVLAKLIFLTKLNDRLN